MVVAISLFLFVKGKGCRPSLPHVIVIAVTNDRSTHQCGHESCLWNDLLITFLQDGAALALALPAVRLVRLLRGYHAIGYIFYYPAAKTIAGFPFVCPYPGDYLGQFPVVKRSINLPT